MKIQYLLIGILVLISLFQVIFGWGSSVVVKNLKVFVEGQEFFIKAVCYNPVPLGNLDEKVGQTGGTGFCSPKMTPFGDWKSACYDSDFFDGSPCSPQRQPPGPGGYPNGEWFLPIWQRDLPKIASIGFNAVRLYNCNPTTLNASINYPELFPYPFGKYHVPFLDYCDSLGLKVIFPLYADKTALVDTSLEDMQQFVRFQIDEVGYHPAILMYTFGNELGFFGEQQWFKDKVNSLIAYARGYQMLKWNRTIPITSAVIDLPPSYATLFFELDVDVFTTNAGYRGPTYTNLWTGEGPNSGVPGLYNLSCAWNKPVFIGEYGAPDNSGWVNDPTWFTSIWKDTYNHIDQGCVGAAFFEWNDEPGKGATQRHMGIVSVTATAGSTTVNVWETDLIAFKYGNVAENIDTINCTNGQTFCLRTDPFTYIGRNPTTLSNPGPDICAAKGGLSNHQTTTNNSIVLPPPPPIPNPAANYTFDSLQNGNIPDVSGSGHTGIVGGNVVLVSGVRGQAIQLNGQSGNQYVNIGSFDITNYLSVSAWIYIEDSTLNINMNLLASKSVWNATTGFQIVYNPRTNLFSLVGSGNIVATGYMNLASKTWYYLTIRINYNRGFIAINGEDITTQSILSLIRSSNMEVLIGSDTVSSSSAGTWTGRIDELVIFDKYVQQVDLNSLHGNTYFQTESSTSQPISTGQGSSTSQPASTSSGQQFTGTNPQPGTTQKSSSSDASSCYASILLILSLLFVTFN